MTEGPLADVLARSGVTGPSVVAVGTFDGVHRGHQRLVQALVARARAHGATSVVLTFDPRPVEVLRPGTPSLYLCSLASRVELLRAAGAEHVIVVPFTLELSRMPAAEFTACLVRQLGLREIVGGPDVALGRGREGTPAVLAEIGKQQGFGVYVVAGLAEGDEVIRSSIVQRTIAAGDLERAAAFLGRPYRVEGTVERGAGRGKQLGFPTANLAVSERLLLPANGIYAVRFALAGERYAGAASLGTNPTFGDGDRALEVYVLDFDRDIYGETATVEFVARLRPERRFDSVSALVEQIRDDVRQVREILGTTAEPG